MGRDIEITTDEQNRRLQYVVYCVLAIPNMVAFGVIHAIRGDWTLAAIIGASCAVLVVGLVALRHVHDCRPILRTAAVLTAGLLVSLAHQGGLGGSKILWSFTFPLIVFYLFGVKEGVLWCLGLLAVTAGMLALPAGRLASFDYPPEFLTRLVIVYLIVSAATFWFELLRVRYGEAVRRERESLVSEIARRREAEGRLVEGLREKEALLKEIHHRVKNNLQIVSSLLRLQLEAAGGGPAGAGFLREIENRIRSTALVHDRLYGSPRLGGIDLRGYVEQLAADIQRSRVGTGGVVEVRNEVEPLEAGLDQAIPLGLILNELVTNALQHAFPDGRSGRLTVRGRAVAGLLELSVIDDGVGFAAGVDPLRCGTLGLQLVASLVDQLGGKLELLRDAGVAVVLRIPLAGQQTS